jgi:hypothetical protein
VTGLRRFARVVSVLALVGVLALTPVTLHGKPGRIRAAQAAPSAEPGPFEDVLKALGQLGTRTVDVRPGTWTRDFGGVHLPDWVWQIGARKRPIALRVAETAKRSPRWTCQIAEAFDRAQWPLSFVEQTNAEFTAEDGPTYVSPNAAATFVSEAVALGRSNFFNAVKLVCHL